MTAARRKMTRGRWLQAAAGAFGLLVIVVAVDYHLGLRPLGAGSAQSFVVVSGERTPTVAKELANERLIRDKNVFITYLNLHGLRAKLKAGTYSIAPTMSAPQIASLLTDGATVNNRLVVPEGYTIAQIETLAATKGITKGSFQAALAMDHTNSFLATKPVGVSLEGYLFPDSYQIDPNTTAPDLVNEMLNTFNDRVGSNYDAAFAAEGLNLHQGLTLASIVEKEVSNSTDRPIVAQIFLKRFKLGMPLGSDVTAQYAADLAGVAFNVNLSSPYNTRVVTGLPPGPICNPGLDALNAVAHPAATDYLYFLAGRDGKTYFATTYAEHQKNIQLHL